MKNTSEIWAYRQVPRIANKACREDVHQAVHAQLPKLREVQQVISLRKEARDYQAKQTTQEENESVSTLVGLLVPIFQDFREWCKSQFFHLERLFPPGTSKDTMAEGSHS
jgi:hypothetical protein